MLSSFLVTKYLVVSFPVYRSNFVVLHFKWMYSGDSINNFHCFFFIAQGYLYPGIFQYIRDLAE